MNKEIKYILFDIDGVVVRAERFSLQYQKKFGIEPDKMLPFFVGVFKDCIIGRADLKKELKPWLKKWKWAGTVEEFLQFWFESENQVDKKLIDKIKQLRKVGVKCYLATKQEKYRIEYMRKEMGFDNIFDGIFSSAELGVKKPDSKFFEIILNRLKIEPGEVLFFDDEQANVEGAESVGIKSFLYTDLEKFEQDLKKFVS